MTEATLNGATAPDEIEFVFVQGKSYIALPRDPKPWLIDKLVPSGGLMNLYGKPKLGKSYAALGIACAVSNPDCTEWLGHPVMKHGPVAYLQVDTPRGEWASRQERLINAGHVIDGIWFTDANLVPYPLNVTIPAVKEKLKTKLAELNPVLLVVDTLREVHEGDENDSAMMKQVITALVECTKDIGCSVLLVSHSRKDQMFNGKAVDDDLMNDGRGSSYIPGRMDVVAKLTEKTLMLKGRAIGLTKIAVEQDNVGMLTLNASKAQSEANLLFVIAQDVKSDAERARLLAGLEGIEPEAARSRIREYRKRNTDSITED